MSETTTRSLSSVDVGEALPPLSIPLTRTLIVATAIASRDYQDVHHDPSLAEERGTWSVPGLETDPLEPPALLGPTVGWGKMWGFWLTFADGIAYPLTRPWGPMPKSWVSKWIKNRHRCLFGRGPEMPPPGNHELSASGCNYITYLYRVMMLGEDKANRTLEELNPETSGGVAVVTNPTIAPEG